MPGVIELSSLGEVVGIAALKVQATTMVMKMLLEMTVVMMLMTMMMTSSSSSGARSGTDIGDHASPNISVIRQLQKI